MYHEYEYEFKINNVLIFFTESEIDFYKDNEIILSLDSWNVDIIRDVYNLIIKED